MAFSVTLSILMFLLFANVVLMCVARSYNAHVCLDAIRAGARASSEGLGDEIVAKVVEHSVETADPPGVFVNPPQVHFVKFGSVRGSKCLVVSTVTEATLPAPMLVFGPQERKNGSVVFFKTYAISLREKA
jgi:hypothetical protein